MTDASGSVSLRFTCREAGYEAEVDTTDDVDSLAAADPRLIYLEQLEEEGVSTRTSSGWRLPWERLYALLDREEHRSSIALLNLPDACHWAPRLESTGSPSEQTFRVWISAWHDGSGASIANPRREGALLIRGDDRRLMSHSCWHLIKCLNELAEEGSGWGPVRRLAAVGEIQDLAETSGARLDRYLSQTRVATTNTVDFSFRSSAALGTRVVEVIPSPTGAPAEFIGQFDRYNSVRARYDVPTSDGGTTHVLPGGAARAALTAIKEIPGRRLASGAAASFLRNPRAVLGEEAADAIDEEAFVNSRIDAGLTFKRLFLESSPDPSLQRIRLVDVDGRVEDEVRPLKGRSDMLALRDSAERSRSRGLPIYSWEGEEIECGPETDALLVAVNEWLLADVRQALSVCYAEVFDLGSYSKRVVGFDGTPIAVPYVARKDAEKGWVPDNIEYGLAPVATDGGAPSPPFSLTPERMAALAGSVAEARRQGLPTVTIDGLPEPVPFDQAEAWVNSFKEDSTRGRERRPPSTEKNPDGAVSRPILRILHNIEQLDFGGTAQPMHEPPLCSPALPRGLAAGTTLLPHQLQGLAWLQDRLRQHERGLSGCLLADDMGLGKTLQALSLIAHYRESHSDAKPCLVVAPVSLLVNWNNEIRRFFDRFPGRVLTVYGAALSELKASADDVDPELQSAGLRKFLLPGFERDSGLVLTTYETLRDYEFSFARVKWGIVVCDEAQKIKTPKALVTRAAKALQADFRIACTGTPVENTLADLWCLFDFFQPGLLGSLNEFTKLFRRAIETRSAGHEQQVESLRSAIDPWVLRRLKEEVASLPPKYQAGHPQADPASTAIPMSALQRQLYGTAVKEFRSAMQKDKRSGTQILALLHRLRMICSNPVAASDRDPDATRIEDHIAHSPKLTWLIGRLEGVRQCGEKAIVFTEFRDIQRIVQRTVTHAFGKKPTIVNGSTSVDPLHEESRQKLIDAFQSAPGFGVIILSTTAVGFGVNIQAANHVIHFTRPWNPAKEDQATDRAYRIGQERPVHVYCPTISGDGFESFDQRVDQLLTDKRALSRDILTGVQELSTEDFSSL